MNGQPQMCTFPLTHSPCLLLPLAYGSLFILPFQLSLSSRSLQTHTHTHTRTSTHTHTHTHTHTPTRRHPLARAPSPPGCCARGPILFWGAAGIADLWFRV